MVRCFVIFCDLLLNCIFSERLVKRFDSIFIESLEAKESARMMKLLLLTFFASCYIFEEGASSTASTSPPIRTTTSDTDTIICHKCLNARTLLDCTTFERCDRKTQECYMDQIITDSADIIFNGGCRSKDVCHSASSSLNIGTGLGRKRALTSCSRCCKIDNWCNKRLCGIQKGGASSFASVRPPIRTTTSDPDTIICHKCLNARTLLDCTTFERCDRKTQECYMDQIITDSADIIFNGGCRSKDVCQSASSSLNIGTGLGRKRALTSCSRCCKTDNWCNKRLCGIQKVNSLGATSCYSCDYRSQNFQQSVIRNPEDCVHMSPCNPSEMCITSTTVIGGKPEFFFGCYSKAVCKVLMNQTFADLDSCYNQDLTDPNLPQHIKDTCGAVEPTTAPSGKRQSGSPVNVCHACCGDTGCNYGDCRVLREQMYAYYRNGLLDANTLKYKTISG